MKPTSVAASIAFLLLAVATVSAQTATVSAQTATASGHDCPGREEPRDEKVGVVEKEGRKFNIFATYCLSQLTAGRDVAVTFWIQTELIPGAPPLEVKEVSTVSKEDVGRITFVKITHEPDDKPPISIQKYKYKVQISEAAEPREYIVQINLGFPDKKERDAQSFPLPVGVNSKGKLEIAKESQSGSFQAALFSTARYTYNLKLRNFFRHYDAHVESITVSSEPAGWISPFTISPKQDEEWIVAATGEKIFTFDFDTAPLSENLIRGFGGSLPQLKFDIRYNDGKGRNLIYDEGKQPIAISPSILVLIGAVLLGLLFGAVVRAVVEFMVFKKRVTRPSVIRVVTYSLVFGLLVVLLTIAGQVEVKSKAISLSSSYDNPLAMLVIGLVSAVAGLQIFIGWYKSLKSD